jgi:hypothetical protein
MRSALIFGLHVSFCYGTVVGCSRLTITQLVLKHLSRVLLRLLGGVWVVEVGLVAAGNLGFAGHVGGVGGVDGCGGKWCACGVEVEISCWV